MKKLFITLSICLIITTVKTQAQNGRLSLGVELALPAGDFGKSAGTGFGGSFRFEQPILNKLGLTGTLGFITFSKKTVSTVVGKYEYRNAMIPIQGGLKYYFKEAQEGFYVMAEVGVHVFTAKVSSPAYTFGGITVSSTEETNSKTNLSYAPEIGYHLSNLDFGLRYQLFSYQTTVSSGTTTVAKTSTQGYLGIRVAYVFGSRK